LNTTEEKTREQTFTYWLWPTWSRSRTLSWKTDCSGSYENTAVRLELQRLWNLLDRHRRRIDRTAVAERALAVRKKIRLRGHDSLREACDVLAARYGVTIEQLLIGEIQ
jgi:hypothetical protein